MTIFFRNIWQTASYPMGTEGCFSGGKAAGAWSGLLISI